MSATPIISRATANFVTLRSVSCQLILDCRGDFPALLYWGKPLSENTTPEMLALLATRQEAPCCSAYETPIGLTPSDSSGFLGHSGLQVHREGGAWTTYPTICSISQDTPQNVLIESRDKVNELLLTHSLFLDPESGILVANTKIRNTGDTPLTLNWCAAPTLMVPSHLEQIMSFEGRWANEFQMRTIDRFTGSYTRENRCGRTSHDSFPGLVIKGSSTNERQGEAYAFHLGWSGNHRLQSEILADGRGYVQMGELLMPGEIILGAEESYQSPDLYAGFSASGLSRLSQQFHQYVRGNIITPQAKQKPRPIHYNTWEAVYFDHNNEKLFELAERAASIGAERFVLDDGWFRGRRNDKAGLGDWYVDESVYPEGLNPLINKVESLGMSFGLWVEPEMVNPDSDLYRAHPDWVLGASPAPQILARNQLVLNIAREDVQNYLYERLDSLLSTHSIAYLKWDMNRELHQQADHTGQAAAHRQTLALYQLLARLRRAHPEVEIESCASGGGRADFGILQHTDRVWTSDSNDALDRLNIQHGFSMFFPAEVMGSHVGPFDCHITGRKINMAARSGVALFGHMGLEVNLLELSDDERTELQSAIALHKQFRSLIHSGHLQRLESPDYAISSGIVSPDKSCALFSYALTRCHSSHLPKRLQFQGLDPNTIYQLDCIWPSKASSSTESILDSAKACLVSGAALMEHGMQMPLILPETLLLFSLTRHS